MNIVRLVIVAPLFVVLMHKPAFALTGDELLKQCSEKSGEPQQARCQSYIVGVAEGISTLSTSMRLLHPESGSYPKLFCAETATPDEMERATKAYLLKNPSARRFNAASEVMLALQKTFPCSN